MLRSLPSVRRLGSAVLPLAAAGAFVAAVTVSVRAGEVRPLTPQPQATSGVPTAADLFDLPAFPDVDPATRPVVVVRRARPHLGRTSQRAAEPPQPEKLRPAARPTPPRATPRERPVRHEPAAPRPSVPPVDPPPAPAPESPAPPASPEPAPPPDARSFTEQSAPPLTAPAPPEPEPTPMKPKKPKKPKPDHGSPPEDGEKPGLGPPAELPPSTPPSLGPPAQLPASEPQPAGVDAGPPGHAYGHDQHDDNGTHRGRDQGGE